MTFTGEYYPSIDNNGRLAIPARLRDGLGERFYITMWYEKCLAIFTELEWEEVCNSIKGKSLAEAEMLRYYLSSNASLVEPDKQGRIIIPQYLRENSKIQDEVAVIGNINRIEIWGKDAWQSEKDKMNPEKFRQMMRELGF